MKYRSDGRLVIQQSIDAAPSFTDMVIGRFNNPYYSNLVARLLNRDLNTDEQLPLIKKVQWDSCVNEGNVDASQDMGTLPETGPDSDPTVIELPVPGTGVNVTLTVRVEPVG